MALCDDILNVNFVADTLKEDECVEGVINFYGTHVVDNDEDNSFYRVNFY